MWPGQSPFARHWISSATLRALETRNNWVCDREGRGSSSCPHGLTGICHPRGAALSSYSSLFEPSSYLSSLRATPSFSGSGQSLGSILDSFLAPTSNLSAKSLGSTMKIDSDFNHFSLLRQDGPRHCHFSPVSLHKLINWSPCLCPFCISASPHSLSTQ